MGQSWCGENHDKEESKKSSELLKFEESVKALTIEVGKSIKKNSYTIVPRGALITYNL